VNAGWVMGFTSEPQHKGSVSSSVPKYGGKATVTSSPAEADVVTSAKINQLRFQFLIYLFVCMQTLVHQLDTYCIYSLSLKTSLSSAFIIHSTLSLTITTFTHLSLTINAVIYHWNSTSPLFLANVTHLSRSIPLFTITTVTHHHHSSLCVQTFLALMTIIV